MHLYDTGNLMLCQVRQGDIVAEQERQTAVVVFEIQALTHTGRQLVDKAEDTVVAAGALLVHQIGIEAETDLLELPFTQAHRLFLIRAADHQYELGVGYVEPIIQHVGDLAPVDRHERITGADARTRRRTAVLHRCDQNRHRSPLLSCGSLNIRARARTDKGQISARPPPIPLQNKNREGMLLLYFQVPHMCR